MNENLKKYTNFRLEKPTSSEYNVFFTYNDYNYYLKLRSVNGEYVPSGRVVHIHNEEKHCPICEKEDRDDCGVFSGIAEQLYLTFKSHPDIKDALSSL